MSPFPNAFQIVDKATMSTGKTESSALAIGWSSDDQNIFRQVAERQNTMTTSDKQKLPSRADLQGHYEHGAVSCLPDVEIHSKPPTTTDLIEQYRRQTYNPMEGRRVGETVVSRETYVQELMKLTREDCEKIGQIADVLSSHNPEKIQALLDSYKDDLATLAKLGGAVSLEMNRRAGKISASSYYRGDKENPTSFDFTVYDSCTGGSKVYRVDAA